MINYVKIIVTLLFVASMQACQNSNRNIDLLNNLLKSKVILPVGSMEVICSKQEVNMVHQKNYYKVILYNDSAVCSPCEVKSLLEWGYYSSSLKKEKGIDLSIIPIFSPSSKDYNSLKCAIKNVKPSFPVYIDRDNGVMKNNPQIPSNPLFHTLILDHEDKVVLVGNPLRNVEIEKLFLQLVSENLDGKKPLTQNKTKQKE